MVNKRFIIPIAVSILLSLFSSCDFFFRTPFPQDLVYIDKAADLKSRIVFPPKEYDLSTLGKIVILRIYYSETWDTANGRLILLDENLNVLYNENGNVGRLQFINALSEYVIGAYYFGTFAQIGKTAPVPLPGAAEPDRYGFRIPAPAKILTFNHNGLQIEFQSFNDDWTNASGTTTISVNGSLEFRNIVFAPAAPSETERAFFFFSDTATHERIFVIKAKLPDFYTTPPTALPTSTPYDLMELPADKGSTFLDFTEKGFINRDHDGNYKLYSKIDGTVIAEKRMNISDDDSIHEAVDINGTYRYVFYEKSKTLYRSRMWW